jgi:hypothetical protein
LRFAHAEEQWQNLHIRFVESSKANAMHAAHAADLPTASAPPDHVLSGGAFVAVLDAAMGLLVWRRPR